MATEKEISDAIGRTLQSITYFPFKAAFKTGRGAVRLAGRAAKASFNAAQPAPPPISKDVPDQGQLRAEEQRRREDVRLSCQLMYDQYAAMLQTHFPPERLEAYFKQYLSDHHRAVMVEKRGVLLKEMIAQLVAPEEESQLGFQSLQEISLYFQEQRLEFHQLNYDAATLQTMLSSLSMQEETTIRSFIAQGR